MCVVTGYATIRHMTHLETAGAAVARRMGLTPLAGRFGRLRAVSAADIAAISRETDSDDLTVLRAAITERHGHAVSASARAAAWMYLLDARVSTLAGSPRIDSHNFAPRAEFSGTLAPSLLTVIRRADADPPA